MGLVPGFVFSVNRRALLAILAIGVSVSYALVAGAAVSGLHEAQDALAGSLADRSILAVDPEGGSFDPADLEPGPDGAIAHVDVTLSRGDPARAYTVRAGPPAVTNDSHVLVSRTSPFADHEVLRLDGHNLTVETGKAVPGAGPRWLGLTPATFQALGGIQAPRAHVAVYQDAGGDIASRLEAQGMDTHEAPATFAFYISGAEQLVSAVRVTVVASALVVALLTSTIVSLELRAKRSSFATLQVYAGRGLVQRLVAGRGLTILAAGHLVGALVTFGLLFLVERAGVARLAIDGGYLATALGATFGGGLAGLAFPVRRAGNALDAQELGEHEAPPSVPGPLRLTLTSWRSLVPLAISAAVLAGSMGVIYGAVDMPGQLFGVDDARVIADTSNNPLRGTAPTFLGTHLGKVEGYEASSPEIYAPTVVDGQPVMVRGVAWRNLASMDPVHVDAGQPPDEPGEAAIGSRLAGKLDTKVGDTYRLASPYHAHVEIVEIVGIVDAPGLLGDEILVPLGTARSMTGLPEDEVNIVRYRLDRSALANGTPEPERPSGLEATDLTVEPASPIPLQEATAAVDLVNFAESSRERHLTLKVNGEPIADTWVEVEGHETGTASMSFRVPQGGLFALEVNPSRRVETGEPAYRIDAPDVATNGTEVTVTVTDKDTGDPVPDVHLQLRDDAARTGEDGRAGLKADPVGNWTILAEGAKGQAATTILVVEPADLYRGRVVFQSISGPSSVSDGPWPGAGTAVNVGGETFEGTATVPVNGEPRNTTELRLPPGASQRVSFSLNLADGAHKIGAGEEAIHVTVGDFQNPDEAPSNDTTNNDAPSEDAGSDGDADGEDASDPDDAGETGGTGSTGDAGEGGGSGESTIRDLFEQRAGRGEGGQGAQATTQPVQAFLADTFENFNAAVTVVVIATVLHAGLIGLVVVRRDVEENARTLGTLASVGADRGRLRRHALREFAIVGTAATALGCLVGFGLVGAAAEMGWIGGFGHALVPRTTLGFALRVGAIALAVILVSAVFAVEKVRGRRLQSLLMEGPVRGLRPPLDKLLGGAP